jgi:transcriptional regulator with XRE-family HTH domain
MQTLNLLMSLGLKIKDVRLKKGYTQSQLADETSITLRTIQRIENDEVKPSLHSLKELSRVLETDFSELNHKSKEKSYEFNFNFKITDMNQFINDLKTLVKNHWKVLAIIILSIWLVNGYTDIKAGIMDGWNGK